MQVLKVIYFGCEEKLEGYLRALLFHISKIKDFRVAHKRRSSFPLPFKINLIVLNRIVLVYDKEIVWVKLKIKN